MGSPEVGLTCVKGMCWSLSWRSTFMYATRALFFEEGVVSGYGWVGLGKGTYQQ